MYLILWNVCKVYHANCCLALTSCKLLHLISVLQLVMEYCIGSASNLLEGWCYLEDIPLKNLDSDT